jgi:hypothetical protein
MLKRSTLIPVFVFITAATHVAMAASGAATALTPVAAAAPVQVKVWTWLLKIENVNYPNDELTVDMFVTFAYDPKFKDKIDPMKHFEVVEAKSVTICEQEERARPEKGDYHQSFRCIAVIGHNWDIRSFPFDRHKIRVSIEDSTDKAGTLVYVADPDSGREEIAVRDRKIADYSVSAGKHTWGWGDGYATYQIDFTLKPQHPWGMFQKLFLAVFIAIAVALLSFFVAADDLNSRSGLLIGGLFAAIANQYVVSSSLPIAGTVTLVDAIHELAYSAIVLCLGLSLLSYKCAAKGRVALSQRIDRWGFRVLLTGYVVVVAVVVAIAITRG